jgi:cold-inducible RNA-binding protein
VKNIYVGNLPFHTTESELRSLFEQYGGVARASVAIDRETGRSRGFGFIEMADASEGDAAIEALDGTDFGGRALKVNEAKPREPRGGGGGFRANGGGGSRGFEGGGGSGGGFGGEGGGRSRHGGRSFRDEGGDDFGGGGGGRDGGRRRRGRDRD